jgi:CBS domain-containing protein
MGGAFALLINQIFPGAQLSPGAYALVAMAAIFGAAARAPFTFIIFAFEITRDYNAILPLMLACVIADGVGLVFMRHSIMTEKLARRGLKVPQEYEVDILQQVTVAEVMDPSPATVLAQMQVVDLADEIARGQPHLIQHQALPIINEGGELVGIITRGDILRSLEQNPHQTYTVLEAGSQSLHVAYADELVHEAVGRMLQHNIGRLPVVSRQNSHQLLGYLGRSAALTARLRRLDEEQRRERGWLPYPAKLTGRF